MSDLSLTGTVEVLGRGLEDQQPELARVLAEEGSRRDGGVVTLMRMADVAEATHRKDVQSTPPSGDTKLGSALQLIPLLLDGQEHRKYRRLLDPLFAPQAISRLEAPVRRLCHQLIDSFADRGVVEFYQAFCVPMPCTIFLELLGLPQSDLEFLLWFKDGMIRPETENHRTEAVGRMIDYLGRILDERSGSDDQPDDLIAGFLQAEVDGRSLSRDELINITFVLTFAGLDTVSASLSCLTSWLARHPDARQRVIEDPRMLPAAIEELLRFESPVPAVARFAHADFELGGQQVCAGDQLNLMLCMANLDSDAVEDPLTVDFDRPTKRHIDFGTGVHRCLGSHLARMELRIALEVIHERIPDYSIDPDRPPRYNNDGGVRTVDPLHLVFTTPG